MKLALLVLIALIVLCTQALDAAEKPQSLSPEQAEAAAAKAPPCPMAAEMDLNLRPLDYIDCTDPADPHEFTDQGTSSVTGGPAGRYRITAGHRHAFFAYRFRSAGKDRPVLIVIEYPDDAVRTINFSTHESVLSGRRNIDWSLETGVYTGDPLPLSNAMQYHTFIMWCQDEWPAVLVGNFHRYGHPAAASRIWAYAIEGGLPKLEIPAADPANPRRLGHFNSLGTYLPIRLYFGARSPNSIEHMLDYYEYIGVNEVSWPVVAGAGGAWFDCHIAAWRKEAPQTDNLDRTLAAMDRRGGFSFVAGFNMPGSFKANGVAFDDMSKEQLLASLTAGFDDFLERYGKYKSLTKIAWGAQYSIRGFDYLIKRGVAQQVVEHIKQRRPDIQVLTYIGGRTLHAQYFDGGEYGDRTAATTGDVIRRWEQDDGPWSETLAGAALDVWRLWGHDPAEFAKIRGLTVYDQYQPDDYRIFGLYAQEPRAMIYYDLDWSQQRDDLLDTDYAAMWNTHFEGWYGLHPEVNFWYQKLWVAPDFNAPPPLSLSSFARIMAHRDRLAITPGSWNNKYFGYEAAIRKFAKAYRTLPARPMTDVTNLPIDTVVVRWLADRDTRYIAVQSRIPFASEVAIDGRVVELGPYELAALVDKKITTPVVTGRVPDAYSLWVDGRIARLTKAYEQVRALDMAAAPMAYARTADRATELLTVGKAFAADQLIGAGLVSELELRRDILDPPKAHAPRISAAAPMDGDLDHWPAKAADIRADDGKYLAGHLYFPNSWSGPDDLSARLRLFHDGTNLYVAAEIRDNKRTEKDGCSFRLSTNGAYRDWKSESAKSNLSWGIGLPSKEKPVIEGRGRRGFTYTCRLTPTGYVIEGSAPLSELGLEPGGKMGFLLEVSDDDGTANLYKAGWARKQVMLVPHQPNFTYYSDVRTCGELVLDE